MELQSETVLGLSLYTQRSKNENVLLVQNDRDYRPFSVGVVSQIRYIPKDLVFTV